MITYRALLHPFHLVCDDPVADSYLREVLAPLRDDTAPPGRVTEYRLARDKASATIDTFLVDGVEVNAGASSVGPIGRFLGLVDRDAERVTSARLPVLHAAAVHRDGRTVVVPGAPNAGKSTLVAHLALAGWTYVSDELIAIAPGAPPRALAYPRAIVLDEGSWSLFSGRVLQPPGELSAQLPYRRHLVPPHDYRPQHGVSYPITDVTLYSWRVGATSRVEELDAVDCLRALLGSSFSVERSPQRDLDTLVRVVDHASCWRVHGEHLDDVQRLLLNPHSVR